MCVAEEMQKMKLESREKDLKEKARYSIYLPAWIVWILFHLIVRRSSLKAYPQYASCNLKGSFNRLVFITTLFNFFFIIDVLFYFLLQGVYVG